jgi:hypothetical protein
MTKDQFFPLRLVLLGCLLALVAAMIFLPRAPERPAPEPIAFTDYPFIEPRGYVCYRARTPIVIDGKLDDAAWKDAPWSEPFVDIEGDKKPSPRYRTRVKMLWDDWCLYIAAELEEPHVWATFTEHDSYIFHEDNDFEVFLDPDGDSHLYAELEMNARNTTWDLLLTKPYKDKGAAIDAWEITGLKTAVHVDGTLNDPTDTDRGWTLEIAWPWTGLKQIAPDLNFPPKDGDRWRINFSRVQGSHTIAGGKYKKDKSKPDDNWVWSPHGAVNMHMPERWGHLLFSTAPPGSVQFTPDPSNEVRHVLHRVLYAQNDHKKARGCWAPLLADLGLGKLAEPPELSVTPSAFEASAKGPGGKRWRINSDARIWSE